MLRGEHVILRTPERDDAEIFAAWQNDRDMASLLPFVQVLPLKALEGLISGLKLDKSKFIFIIENEDQIPIGVCSLKEIDWINGTAFIDIVIYARSCWGKGYGCDAVRVLTAFGLDDINLYTIHTGITEDNEKAIKCFESAGYENEGILYSRVSIKGCRKNLVSLSISKDSRQDV